MICLAKSGLTENFYIVHKEEISITCESQGACRQDELIGGKPLVVK
jgi:hypothetical protein